MQQKNLFYLAKTIPLLKKSYEEYIQKLGKSLVTTVNHYNHAYKELNKIDKDVLRITGQSENVDPIVIGTTTGGK